jgi:diadenosine tetraphosphate (Ap4A) HIT family hydrolase
MATLFTRIVDGEIPGRFVWSDEVCVAFATIAPISPGHVLVVPRAEVDRFTAAPDELLAHLMTVAKIVGTAQEKAFGAPRAALLVAGFEVPHLHLHVLPAWGEAHLSFADAKPDTPGDELDAAMETLRDALRDAGHGDHVPVRLGSPALA